MLSSNEYEFFRQNSYLVLEEVFTDAEVGHYRKLIRRGQVGEQLFLRVSRSSYCAKGI